MSAMDNYEPLEVIGSGSFGVIRKVRRRSDGKILARKEIDYRKMTDKEKRQLVAEVNILRDLRHPNIVRYYERCVDKENCLIYIIMEFCEGGDLSSIIKRCKQEKINLKEETIWVLFTQLLLALHECHHGRTGRGEGGQHFAILHRDLKPDNVFLDGDKNIKLGDFGLSRTLGAESEFARTFVGVYIIDFRELSEGYLLIYARPLHFKTPYYMSPELINESAYDIKSDIWALGCLIYELCALKPPFEANTQAALALKIKSGKYPPLPKVYSPALNDAVRMMLQVNSAKRPTAAEFLRAEKIQRCIEKMEIIAYNKEVKAKEEEVKKREQAVESREQAVSAMEAKLLATMEELREKERTLIEWEKRLAVGDESRGRPDRHNVEDNFVTSATSSNSTASSSSSSNSTRTPSRRVSSQVRHSALLNGKDMGQLNKAINGLKLDNGDTGSIPGSPMMTDPITPSKNSAGLGRLSQDDDIPSPFLKRVGNGLGSS